MYIVTEIQTNPDGQIGTLTTAFDNLNAAEAKYHTVLAAAAVSTGLIKHGAIMYSEEGFPLKHECYTHQVVAAPAVAVAPEPVVEEESTEEVENEQGQETV